MSLCPFIFEAKSQIQSLGKILVRGNNYCVQECLSYTMILRKLTQILSWCASAAVKDFSEMLWETD